MNENKKHFIFGKDSMKMRSCSIIMHQQLQDAQRKAHPHKVSKIEMAAQFHNEVNKLQV